MTRIVHLSDLHMGAHDPAMIAPLIAAVTAAQPDLVVVSGDLAQRGTRVQFAQASQVLGRLPGPLLCVPGNHDLPHFNPLLRLVDGYRRFRRATDGPEEPVWRGGDTLVAGINTAHRGQWMRGLVSARQIAHLRQVFARAAAPMRIAVMHHPLEHTGQNARPLMLGAARALGALTAAGVRVVLSGHVHVSHVAPFRAAPGVLLVQTGTALSTRRRGQENCFICLDTGDDALRITRYMQTPRGFTAGPSEPWQIKDRRWAPVTASGAAPSRVQLPR